MSRLSTFADNFWGTEDITKGFHVLCTHMRKGKKFQKFQKKFQFSLFCFVLFKKKKQ